MIGETLDVDIERVIEYAEGSWEEKARSTKYHHIKRYMLLERIAEKYGNGKVECFNCRSKKQLETHHVNQEKSRHDLEGWKHLYQVIEHFEEGEPFKLLCLPCHKHKHKNYNLNDIEMENELKRVEEEGLFGGLKDE